MKVLVTGSDGFVGKNLVAHLRERKEYEVLTFTRTCEQNELSQRMEVADFVFHLAGVNRPAEVSEFATGNTNLTRSLVDLVRDTGRAIPIVFTSSMQALNETPYGRSKRAAEDLLLAFSAKTHCPVYIYRLTNVFGKWCRPNYNSVVATFCHNVVREIPIAVNDPTALVSLIYIDDVVAEFLEVLDRHREGGIQKLAGPFREVHPVYSTTVGALADQIRSFKESRTSLTTDRVGTGFLRGLYATYCSYLPPGSFAYPVPKQVDHRGEFAEVLKTVDSGQFSYFTAHPGVTRGGHYHHSKNEKFLVLLGCARFRFRHIVTGEVAEITTSAEAPQVVETVPGWAHDVTNVGDGEMIMMLWANEIFDPARPDTFACTVT